MSYITGDDAIYAIKTVEECYEKGEPIPLSSWLTLNTYILNLTNMCQQNVSKDTSTKWPGPSLRNSGNTDSEWPSLQGAASNEPEPVASNEPEPVASNEPEPVASNEPESETPSNEPESETPSNEPESPAESIPVEAIEIFYKPPGGHPNRFNSQENKTAAIVWGDDATSHLFVPQDVFRSWGENNWIVPNQKPGISGLENFIKFSNISETDGAFFIDKINGTVELLFDGTCVVKDEETGLVFYTDFSVTQGTRIENGNLVWSKDYKRYYVKA